MPLIYPDWPLPDNVRAVCTTRQGGVSVAPYDSFNLGSHVQDDPLAVAQNRLLLTQLAQLPQSPLFLNQIHSTQVVRLPLNEESLPNADAVYTNEAKQVCLVMTADCLPVLFCAKDGSEIGAVHAGWKGLCNGILEAMVAEFACAPSEITVWLGPAISQKAFQVGEEVVDKFCQIDPQAKEAFISDPNCEGKFFGDLYRLAKQRLQRLGIESIYGGEYCTYSEVERFFSYRREAKTGRMATLIWRTA